MYKELRLVCCYLDNETWESCDATATYEIIHGRSPDDYTHTCNEHIFEMLTDASHHELITLPEQEKEIA